MTCQEGSTLIDYEIGARVVIEKYDVAPIFVGEIGTVVGYSPTGKFLYVQLDNQEQFKCLDKWVKPHEIRRI